MNSLKTGIHAKSLVLRTGKTADLEQLIDEYYRATIPPPPKPASSSRSSSTASGSAPDPDADPSHLPRGTFCYSGLSHV